MADLLCYDPFKKKKIECFASLAVYDNGLISYNTSNVKSVKDEVICTLKQWKLKFKNLM